MKGYFVIAVYVLIAALILSACTHNSPTQIDREVSTPTQSLPTVTAFPSPSPIPEDVSNALFIEAIGSYSIRVTNLTSFTPLSIYRRLINEYEKIADIPPGKSFIDTVQWDGTQYYYWGEDAFGNKSKEVGAVTDIAEITYQRGLFYSWNEIAEQKNTSDEIINIPASAIVFDYMLHGVDVKLVYEKPVADKLTSLQMESYFLKAAQLFHRHWQLYEAFPIDEYRITCWDKELAIVEDVKGHQIDLNTLLETIDGIEDGLSHGIGHAWISEVLKFDNGWLWEGFTEYNEIITLPDVYRNRRFIEDLSGLMTSPHVTKPLQEMYSSLYGTSDAIQYYWKGSFFAHKISMRLVDDAGLSYQQFLKHLYDKYFLTQNTMGQDKFKTKLITTNVLLQELNAFSGLDFTDMFEMYVWGNGVIYEGLEFEDKYFPNYPTTGQFYLNEPIGTITPNIETNSMISITDGMPMVFVHAGEFQMGSEFDGSSLKEHKVYLDSYWIDQTEVTNAMYQKCVEACACRSIGLFSETYESYLGNPEFDNYPVNNATWEDAKTYCEWAGRQLPTEAQWEKAARGLDDRIWPWGLVPFSGRLVNFADKSRGWWEENIDDGYLDLAPVGSFPEGASPYGALDLAGNVFEWVADWYDDKISYEREINPLGPSTGVYKIQKGGNYNESIHGYLNLSSRFPTMPTYFGGFRCAVGTSPAVTLPTPAPEPTHEFEIISETSPKDSMTMVLVPSSDFLMGLDGPMGGETSDYHLNTIFLDTFWIDQTEITNEMYAKCMNDGICTPPQKTSSITRDDYFSNPKYSNYPVINVTWDQSKAYCEWAGRRLPTDNEWEKAGRGIDGRVFPWGNHNLPPNCDSLSRYEDTTQVMSFLREASPYGAFDMLGNVWEWVSGSYAPYDSKGTYSSINPRIIRGGDSGVAGIRYVGIDECCYPVGMNIALVEPVDPEGWFDSVGFRCAEDYTP